MDESFRYILMYSQFGLSIVSLFYVRENVCSNPYAFMGCKYTLAVQT